MNQIPHDWTPLKDEGSLVCPCCGYYEFYHNFGDGLIPFNWKYRPVRCKFCNHKTVLNELLKIDGFFPNACVTGQK